MIIVDVTWDRDRNGWHVRTDCPGADPTPAWMVAAEDDTGRTWPLPDPARRPESDDASWDRGADELRDLSTKITSRTATLADAVAYGRHLFDALFGQEAWKLVEDAHDGDGPLVVGLRWPADQGTLHRMVWELLHDGSSPDGIGPDGRGFLTIRAQRPVVPVRLVPSDTPAPSTIQSLPKVLFAVGAEITDHRVRAGAEFMGVLRGLEREGGAIHSRVLAKATATQLGTACDRITPDIVHLIAHGRWDSQANVAKLELRNDSGGTEEVTAEMIAKAVIGTGQRRHPPTVVIVSACQSGTTSHDAGVPMAARLIQEGIPLTVAMVGDVADTACRVFTRSVADAIARGHPLTAAIADGRRAALLHTRAGAAPDTFDWALPALFASHPVPAEFRLVDDARIKAVRDRIVDFDLARPPLFCGRDEQLADIERLLDPADSLSVLVARTDREGHFGGTRLLRELAAAAIRDRHLPVLIGPFLTTSDAPKTLAALAQEIGRQLVLIAGIHGVHPPLRLLARAAGVDPAEGREIGALHGAEPVGNVYGLDFAADVRADLTDLRDRVAGRHPEHVRPDATTLLLLDDVHLYEHALGELLKQLLPTGLGAAPDKQPVAIFGKSAEGAGACLTDLDRKRGSGWLTCHTLGHVVELAPDLNRLVFLWWFLHPEPGTPGAPTAVLAPAPGDDWIDVLRALATKVASFYDPASLAAVEQLGTPRGWLAKGDDDDILQAYGMRR